MIIGHVGVALAARGRWPSIPVLALLAASFACDLLRELLQRVMHSSLQANLYSHALPWSAALAAVLGLCAWRVAGSRVAGLVVAALVASHVALDLVSGSKPLWIGGPRGMNGNMFVPLELLIESVLLGAGMICMRVRKAPSAWYAGWWAFAALLTLQVVFLAGAISQRPYLVRCVGFPRIPCGGSAWYSRRWQTTPFWE
jgi:hypothetical protein